MSVFKKIKNIVGKQDLPVHEGAAKESGTHIFIACLPKSGSTFIAKTIVNLTGFQFFQFQGKRGTNDHNIDAALLKKAMGRNTVTQLHTKATVKNLSLLGEQGIKTVFLHRGILDSLRSFHNHVLTENDKWFMFTVAAEFRDWHSERQFDFLIDLVVPWYVNFLTSWQKVISEGSMDVLSVDYDNFKENNVLCVADIMNFYDLESSNSAIQSALEATYKSKEPLRFNKDKKEGKYEFTQIQMDRIERMIAYYPEYKIKL